MKHDTEIAFAEMFSGIGGFRLALKRANDFATYQLRTQSGEWNQKKEENLNEGSSRTSSGARTHTRKLRSFRCVWANDWDRYANKIYRKNFGSQELTDEDIRNIQAKDIPDFDVLTAGFPCQAFSVAGKRKATKDSRGTLFTHIARVAARKRPKLLLLENVKGLLSSESGRTFAIILRTLANLGYLLEWQVLNSKHFGVPQNRERVFLVGHLAGASARKIFPIQEISELPSAEAKGEPESGEASTLEASYGKTKNLSNIVVEPLILADRTRTLAGKGRNLESPKPITNALSGVQKDNLVLGVTLANTSRYKQGVNRTPIQKDGLSWGLNKAGDQGVLISEPRGGKIRVHRNDERKSEIQGYSCFTKDAGFVDVVDNHPKNILHNCRIRRLTPVECERLQGFPDGWTEGVSDTQRYKLLGNAVTVNVVEFLGRKLRECLNQQG